MTVIRRFFAKVDLRGACWLWTAGRYRNGYGQFYLGGKKVLPHRVLYEWTVGPIPAGLDLDHLCRVRHCVRPSHLEPVTRRENLLRGVTIPAAHAAKTHCPAGHPYAGANLRLRPNGARRCRECSRLRQRAA